MTRNGATQRSVVRTSAGGPSLPEERINTERLAGDGARAARRLMATQPTHQKVPPAAFRPYVPPEKDSPRIHPARGRPGRLAGNRLRGGHCLPGAARRADGERLDSRRGAFHQHLQVAGAIDYPRKQHRADGGFGGRIHRCRCGFHPAGADFPRLFARCFGYPPRSAAGARGKRAGRPFCDSLATPVECGGARHR